MNIPGFTASYSLQKDNYTNTFQAQFSGNSLMQIYVAPAFRQVFWPPKPRPILIVPDIRVTWQPPTSGIVGRINVEGRYFVPGNVAITAGPCLGGGPVRQTVDALPGTGVLGSLDGHFNWSFNCSCGESADVEVLQGRNIIKKTIAVPCSK